MRTQSGTNKPCEPSERGTLARSKAGEPLTTPAQKERFTQGGELPEGSKPPELANRCLAQGIPMGIFLYDANGDVQDPF